MSDGRVTGESAPPASEIVTADDVADAHERLDGVVHRTPLDSSRTIADRCGAERVDLKLENVQRTGSFKIRGAYNAMAQLPESVRERGVVASSAGNHAQGVALAGDLLDIDTTIVVPEITPAVKIDATRGYGADVVVEGELYEESYEHALRLAEDEGLEFVHPFDDAAVIAGQGTVGREIAVDAPGVDAVLVSIGGGGLISGIATAIKHHDPEIRVVGVQAEGAETVHESLDKGVPVTLDDTNTIADGIATGGISELTLRTIEEHVDEVVTVSDGEIAEAILLLLERAKQVVEGAGAASVAAVLSDDLDVEGETVMPLLCGGNLDMTMLQTVLVHALTSRRQTLRLRVRIRDEPGEMARLSRLIADRDANIHDVRHVRAVDALDVGEAHLLFRIETKGAEHAAAVVDTIEDAGYAVDDVSEPS